MNQPEKIEVTQEQIDEYQKIQKIRDAMTKLRKNKDFKLFYKFFMEDSVINLSHNLGVNPEMKEEIIKQIEARRIVKSFIDMIYIQGQTADEVLGGLDG